MIKIRNLVKAYANVTPLNDVSVDINDGEIISVIGPSGAGKSTLLRCLNLLERPTGGKIYLDDLEITSLKNLSEVRQKMGMVFQNFNLFGHLTVIENIMLAPVDLLGVSKHDAYENGMKLLKTVGLAEKALNYPDELSGGQKQRIAIARTLAMNPDIILFDEPTSALDPTMVGEVQAVIRELAKSKDKTLIIVTHEMNFAKAISTRVFYMDEGGIYEDGTPEQIFNEPKRERTRRFIKRLKVLELNILNKNYDFIKCGSDIEQYCVKNQISSLESRRVMLAFEELVQQNLINYLDEPPASQSLNIDIAIEYAEQQGVIMNVNYAGEALNILEQADELSLNMLKSASEELRWSYEADDNINKIYIKIKR